MIKNLEKQLSTDANEMILHLSKEKNTGLEKILKLIETTEGLNKLEKFILEESKMFGGFAFKTFLLKNNVLTPNKILIKAMIQANPELEVVHLEYLLWINLEDINPALSKEEAKSIKKKMENFLKEDL